MIKTIRLHNFKAFQDTGEIELKPFTVLAGPNSGGKTSILQSLLLLKQTLELRSPEIDLNLDGRFLQFSKFNELIFSKPILKKCKVGYEISLETGMFAEDIPKYFPKLSIPKNTKSLPLRSYIKFSFRYREAGKGKNRVIMDHFDMNSQIRDLSGPRLTIAYRGKNYQVKLKGIDLPEQFQKRKIKNAWGSHFLPSLLLLGPDIERKEEKVAIIQLDKIFSDALMILEYELKDNLIYLGPLREEPQRMYPHSGSPFPEIGNKGEYAAQMLWLEKNNEVQYLPEIGKKFEKLTLLDAVSKAFLRLGIVEPIDIKSIKAMVYQVLFGLIGTKDKKLVTIADVGFGVSQLLPIVVMGLRSPKQSILLFEQPEIHLHPKLQANLADFFLTLIKLGKRLLVETHSDHFINRLRRRIAEDSNDELKEKISILFVKPPHDGQGATIESLRVDRYGVIENWPPEFLPESADEAEAIFRAGLEKRKGD